jgi:hypothetical protein
MKKSLKIAALAAPLTILAGLAFAQQAADAPPKGPVKPIIMTAMKTATAPKLDALAADEVWKKAPAVQFTAVKGIHFKDDAGTTTGTLQAVYSGDMVYFLLQYEDPTESFRRSPFVKGQDGKWTKAGDPDDKGGDNNKVYEDKFAMLWNIDDSIFGFNEKLSCQTNCHSGEPGKPYGNKYTADDTELGDIWHMKTVRTGSVGQIDNQYLDHTRFDPEKSPEAGRKSDPKTGGGYTDVKLVDGKPEFMTKEGTYWIKEGDKVPFDDTKFKPGDEVASIIVAPFTGERGAIASAMKWENGKWTFAFSRKLTTSSKFDVQFKDLGKPYGFGVSLFDNAQVRHAYVQQPMHLTFEK